jgi:hypothetical protein
MTYLQRLDTPPDPAQLNDGDRRYLQSNFEVETSNIVIPGHEIFWDQVDEVEVAQAARAAGPAGWLVRHIIHGSERYHVAIYYGRQEAVLPNLTFNAACYIVQSIAFYVPGRVRYYGPEGIAPLTEY